MPHEKKACEICGEMVSTHHLSQIAHAKKHAMEPEAKTEEVSAPQPEKQMETQINKKPAEVKFANEEIKKMYEAALAKQAEMLKAPDVFIAEDSTDQFRKLVEVYAPETIDQYDGNGKLVKRAEFHAYFGDPAKINQDVLGRGYLPKTDGEGNQVYGPGGEPLYTIPRRIFEARENQAQMESRKRLKRSLDVGKVKEARSNLPMPTSEDEQYAKYVDGQIVQRQAAMGE